MRYQVWKRGGVTVFNEELCNRVNNVTVCTVYVMCGGIDLKITTII